MVTIPSKFDLHLRLPDDPSSAAFHRAAGCFRNLVLMTRLQLLFPKALALHCGPTGIGEAKFGFNPLLHVYANPTNN